MAFTFSISAILVSGPPEHLFILAFSDDATILDDSIPSPRFTAKVKNQTVTAGRATRLTCKVKDLGNYKVTPKN